jgi:hypothetical protein
MDSSGSGREQPPRWRALVNTVMNPLNSASDQGTVQLTVRFGLSPMWITERALSLTLDMFGPV